MSIELTDLELQALWTAIGDARLPAEETPVIQTVEAIKPVIEGIISRRLIATRKWVGGRDA